MTTLAAFRSAVETAIEAEGLDFRDSWTGEPPYAVMFWNGSDLAPTINEQAAMDFVVRAVVAKALDDVAMSAMDAVVLQLFRALWGMAGVQVTGADPLSRNTVGPDTMYVVSVRVKTLIDIS